MYDKLLLALKNAGFYLDDEPKEHWIAFTDGQHKGKISVAVYSMDLMTDDGLTGMHTDSIQDILDTILSL